jgi:hypothetical protein
MMQCGAPDPKYLLRDMEQRLKSVAWNTDTKTAPAPVPGLWARVRAAFARLNWKEATDV